jgi:hypothetical protein
VRLCKSIARVCGVEVRDPLAFAEGAAPEGTSALPEGVKLIRTLEFGVPFVTEALWERLGIGRALRKVIAEEGCGLHHERALLAMTANRLCAPESKLGVWDRWLSKVYMPSCNGLNLHQIYEAINLLHRHIGKIEDAVFFHTAKLFNLVVDLIFYDTTTASFSIDKEDEDAEDTPGLRKFGHAKNGTWSPQIMVALAVTREGLPVRSWVFAGNASEFETIQKVREDLRGWKLGRALFVADSGINSKDNRDELARACGKYLLGAIKSVRRDARA